MIEKTPEPTTIWLVGGVLVILAIATGAGQILKRRYDTVLNPAIVEQFHLRIRSWWIICSALAAAFILGRTATVILFGAISFFALREFITATPTRRADHRALFWVFFFFTPFQYVLVGFNMYDWYAVVIPVFGFLFIAGRIALAGDYKRFLQRIAVIQAGLMISVYCLSHAPALLTQDLPIADPSNSTTNQPAINLNGDSQTLTEETESSSQQRLNLEDKARLLFFFVLMIQLGDVAQYLWGKLLGRRVIAPEISGDRTWEGIFGGICTATVLGALLWWATPFHAWESATAAAIVTAIGFAGGMTMSAIKRDRGVRDYGTLVVGHGGVLDRIDSICFAAPVFFYLTRLLTSQ
ncbi:MAG: phosphatidate cytidylyltransferase [Pirellulales bacterium]|nr:phosphatidate cytidylyltransferase [Pirellulales bacterium]